MRSWGLGVLRPDNTRAPLGEILHLRGMTSFCLVDELPHAGEGMRDHRRLDTFNLADELAMSVYSSTAGFPARERFAMVSQMRRAAVSAATNIVEGCGRKSEADFRRFLNIAFASVRELGYLIELSHRLGYLPPSQTQNLRTLQSRTAAALSALDRSFDR